MTRTMRELREADLAFEAHAYACPVSDRLCEFAARPEVLGGEMFKAIRDAYLAGARRSARRKR